MQVGPDTKVIKKDPLSTEIDEFLTLINEFGIEPKLSSNFKNLTNNYFLE